MQSSQPNNDYVHFSVFVKDWALALGVNHQVVRVIYREFVKIIASYLKQGKRVSFPSFGSFKLQVLPPRTNITATGCKINMKTRKIVRFRASYKLKKLIYDN